MKREWGENPQLSRSCEQPIMRGRTGATDQDTDVGKALGLGLQSQKTCRCRLCRSVLVDWDGRRVLKLAYDGAIELHET